MKQRKITEKDYIKAHRKASREEEIRDHGHPLPKNRIHKSKKAYDRNKAKAGLKTLPDFLWRYIKPRFDSQHSCQSINFIKLTIISFQ